MILLIDNYDSFSYNLYQLVGGLNPDVRVVRNDGFTLRELDRWNPTHILLSPGPGRPSEAGLCEEVILQYAHRTPILGVCLGHQAICEAFGATVTYARELMHGKPSELTIDTACPIFAGLPARIQGARYHSLSARERTLPADLVVTARAPDGEVMAVMHRDYPVYGVQFHPESVLTPDGLTILENFIRL